MKCNVVAEYDYYTLDQAKEIVLAEIERDRTIRNQRITEKRKIETHRRRRAIVKIIDLVLSILALWGIAVMSLVVLKDCTFLFLVSFFTACSFVTYVHKILKHQLKRGKSNANSNKRD